MPVCKSYSTAAEADKQLCKESDLERVALDLNLVFILIMYILNHLIASDTQRDDSKAICTKHVPWAIIQIS